MFPSPFLHLSTVKPTSVEMPEGMLRMEIDMHPELTDEAFFEFCKKNHPFRIEKNKHQKIIVIAPVGFKGGQNEGKAYGKLFVWHDQLGKGWITNPSVAFRLPDGSTSAPDAAWVADEKIARLTEKEFENFLPVVPDFVIEVRSKSDSLKKLKEKMKDTWMANGVRLAWLIDPIKQKSYIYRENASPETVSGFENKLSGEKVCPGFEFDLSLLII